MGKIIQLDQTVVNQIAAGEIIERPASVVKELVENSIDAGATIITVEIENGGKDLIRIVDNGEGISREDLPIALLPHATSKLATSDELAEVATLGFRGEALASIGAISKFSISSRTAGATSGSIISCEYGKIGDIESVGMREGTIMEISGIFKNLPAREKFLKSASSESSFVHEVMQRFSLAFPMIGFRMKSGSRTSLFVPPASNLLARIRKIYGDEIANSLIEVNYENPQIGAVRGYVSKPPTARGNSKAQYTFLNGRYIKDRQIQMAITESYRGRLISRQYPLIFLSYIISPKMFDVNVHPTKVEVRFLDKQKIFSLTLGAINSAMVDNPGPLTVSANAPSEPPPEVQKNVKRSILDFYTPSGGAFPRTQSRVRKETPLPLKMWQPKRESQPIESQQIYPTASQKKHFDNWTFLGTLANTFLLFSEGNDLIVIDQHALHERILYEEILKRKDKKNSQRLLIPQMVEMSAGEFAYFEKASQKLIESGFEIEKFGERTVAIHAIPASFSVQKCAQAFQNAIAEVSGEGKKDDGEKLLETMACKAAVKAGDSLSWSEITALLTQYKQIEDKGNTCPHGRPAVVRIQEESVRKWFKRT